MDAMLQSRIQNLIGDDMPMGVEQYAEGGEVDMPGPNSGFETDLLEGAVEGLDESERMGMGIPNMAPSENPNQDLESAINELMMARGEADDEGEVAYIDGLINAAEVGTNAPMAELAMQLSQAGRGGDVTLAHLRNGEIVLPPESMDDPAFESAVEKRLIELDMDPQAAVVGAGIASLNPITGLEEFGWFKKTWKSVKKVAKKVIKPIAAVAQFIPGPWQPIAALANKAFTVYDVAKGRASPLALAGAFAPIPGASGAAGAAGTAASVSKGLGSLGKIGEFVTKGANGVGLLGNVGKALGSAGKGIAGLISGGGADNIGSFGRLGDFLGGASKAGKGIAGLISGGGADNAGSFGRLGDFLGGTGGANKGIAGLISGGGADNVGRFGRVGDFLGGIGDATGLTNYGAAMAGAPQQEYEVQAGDTLSGIAAKHGIPLELLKANNQHIKDPDMIITGQILRLPGGTVSVGAGGTGATGGLGGIFSGPGADGQGSYGVVGDFLGGITDKLGLTNYGGTAGTGASGSGGLGGLGTLGAIGAAGLLGKLAYDEAKNRKGVALTPLTQEGSTGRYNIEAEIARRTGQPAPNPVEYGLLPTGTIPTLSGGRRAPEEEPVAARYGGAIMSARYGGPVMPMAYAKGGNVAVEDFERMNGGINGEGTEISDDVPAMLSDGEFVMTGQAVRGAGAFDLAQGRGGIITLTPNGGESRDGGTALMYEMMDLFAEFADKPKGKAA